MVKLRSNEDKRLAELPILEAGLPLVQTLSIGDEVGVHVLGSSWAFYGGDGCTGKGPWNSTHALAGRRIAPDGPAEGALHLLVPLASHSSQSRGQVGHR